MNKNQEKELEQKKREYSEYIEQHRSFVKLAFNKYNESKISDLTPEEMQLLAEEIEEHDMSKYSLEEFDIYRRKFYPCCFEEDVLQEEFYCALKHHYSKNSHHPQNSTRRNGLNKVACIHNVLDWIAMGYNFKNTVWDFYNNPRSRKTIEMINSKEKIYIEKVLNEIKNKKGIFYPEEIER